MNSKHLTNHRRRISFNFECEGHLYRAAVNRIEDGTLAELFLDAGEDGEPLQTYVQTAAALVSLLLQHRIAPHVIRQSIDGPVALALELAEVP